MRILGFGPGEVVTELAMKGAVRAEGLAAAVLVATVWPLAAVALAAIWLLVGRQLRAGSEADFTGTDPSSWSEPLRRSRYLKQMALLPPRATMLVSHRFSIVRMDDLIVVLDHGRVVEVGSHTELLARRGLYAELFELQARSYR